MSKPITSKVDPAVFWQFKRLSDNIRITKLTQDQVDQLKSLLDQLVK